MGLKTEWKAILNEVFGYCRLDGVPDGTEIDMVIDDGSLAIRRTSFGIRSWSDLGQQIRTRIMSYYTPALKRYVVTFDESNHVPPSKQAEQEKRRKATFARGITPLTETELAQLKIERGHPLPEPKDQFIERLMITSAAKARLFAFCTAEIASVQFGASSSSSGAPSLPSQDLPGSASAGAAAADMEIERADLYSDTDGRATATGDVDVIVDGGRVAVLDERRRGGDNGFEILLKPAEYLSHEAACIYVVPGEKPCIRVEPSSEIGEGDLKIVRHISMLEGGNVYVRSCDTDMIVILLLNMRRWINRETGHVRFGIFLDTASNASAAASGKNLIDVVSLWRSILTVFRDKYPGIPCPIETVCLLLLLTGGDYAEGFSQLGPRRLWAAFCDGGHNVLFEGSESIRTSPVRVPEKQRDQLHAEACRHAVHISGGYGVSNDRYSLQFNEARILSFVAYAYHKCLSLRPGPSGASMESVRRLVAQKTANARARWKLVSDDEMRAVTRRVWWCMDYQANGALSKRHQPFLDPAVKHPNTGLSVHGWDRDAHESGRVTPSKVVHT